MNKETANLNFNFQELRAMSVALSRLADTLPRGKDSPTLCASITKIDRAIEECKLQAKWKAEDAHEAFCDEHGIQLPKC